MLSAVRLFRICCYSGNQFIVCKSGGSCGSDL